MWAAAGLPNWLRPHNLSKMLAGDRFNLGRPCFPLKRGRPYIASSGKGIGMAVYANSHVRVTIFGTHMDGNEEWQTGFHMGSEDSGGGNFDVPAGFCAALLPLWSTFFTSSSTAVINVCKTVGIKASVINGSDGHVDISTTQIATYSSPVAGTSTSPIFPAQIALVAQLRAAGTGLGTKGRMFLPGIAHSMQGNGVISNANAQSVANNLRTFFDAAEAVTLNPGYVMNVSKGRVGVPFTAPLNKRVTSVRVGTVYDTQRRRRNGLAETYMGADLAA